MTSACGQVYIILILTLVCHLIHGVHVVWCVHESSDFKKCQELSHEFSSVGYLPILCWEELDPNECLKLVSTSSKTIMTVDAGYLYHAQMKFNNIRVVLAEYNGLDEIWSKLVGYYSVALVKAGNHDLKLLNLQGQRVCHGVFDEKGSSGWDIPLGLLSYHSEFHKSTRCNILDKINRYFGESCLPSPLGEISGTMRTCQACFSGSCSQETRYSGEAGGLRCLIENAGDVAFLRHQTIFEYLDDKSGEYWAAGLKNLDFRLLCPDGRQTTVENYKWCHTGIMMSNTLIVSGNMSEEMVTDVQQQIRNPPPEAQKFIFSSVPYSVTSNKVIFSDDTVELVPIKGIFQNPRNFLDQYMDKWNPSYLQAMDSLYCNESGIRSLHLQLMIGVFINSLFRVML